jgi:hypothetical protein
MLRFLIATVAALSLAGIGPVGAAAKKKARQAPPAVTNPTPAYPNFAPTPRPPWAGPGECYTDEGYGRYWPCGAGKDR